MIGATHAADVQETSSENQIQEPIKLQTIVVTAEEQLKQSLGTSVITEEDLDRLPVTNDISEYVRRMPGVNLTGNSSSGVRGNNRQIDIRGMGPENTLILIDGNQLTHEIQFDMGGVVSVIQEGTQIGFQLMQ